MTSTRRRLRLAGAALGAISALAVAACSSTPDPRTAPVVEAEAGFVNETVPDGAPVRGGRIVYGVPSETNSLYPGLAMWDSHRLTLARSIYDTLAVFDADGVAQPFLAERFDHNPAFTVWTVTLRRGITYSNGKPFTAESFVAAQQHLRTSLPVFGDVYDGIGQWKVTGLLTFEMHATRPWTSFPDIMASQLGVGVDPDWLASDDILRPIGTGPFVVDYWNVDNEIVLKRNPSYWRHDARGMQLPYLDQVTFRVIPEEAERVEALRSSQIDVMIPNHATASTADLVDDARAGRLQAFSDERFETLEEHVLVNTAKPPFDDVDARRALAHALDLDDYVAKVTRGVDQPADSPWKPGSTWHTPVDYPRYDPAEARRLVDAVKARNGGRFSVTLLGGDTEESIRTLQYVQREWAKVGIDAKVETTAPVAKLLRTVQGDFEVMLAEQFDSVNPGPDTAFWRTWGKPLGTFSPNFSRLADETLDRLSLDALGSTGPAEHEAYAAISRRIAELVPYVWLAHTTRTVIASPELAGVVRSELPNGRPQLPFVQGSHSTAQIWRTR